MGISPEGGASRHPLWGGPSGIPLRGSLREPPSRRGEGTHRGEVAVIVQSSQVVEQLQRPHQRLWCRRIHEVEVHLPHPHPLIHHALHNILPKPSVNTLSSNMLPKAYAIKALSGLKKPKPSVNNVSSNTSCLASSQSP